MPTHEALAPPPSPYAVLRALHESVCRRAVVWREDASYLPEGSSTQAELLESADAAEFAAYALARDLDVLSHL